MADKHPYISGSGPLFQAIAQLRKSFPAGGVTAETLKKLGLAPNNESYVINTLRFVSVIDEEGKRTQEATKVFSQHDETAFQKAFAPLVKSAYSDLFDVHGDDAWKLDLDSLIQYFRSTDDTSSIVGRRQATTFQALSALSGHAEAPAIKVTSSKKSEPKSSAKKSAKAQEKIKQEKPPLENQNPPPPPLPVNGAFGLTVRVEINLPADGDQDTYDRIFKSIRENLINGQ